jgi:hypothetical protein
VQKLWVLVDAMHSSFEVAEELHVVVQTRLHEVLLLSAELGYSPREIQRHLEIGKRVYSLRYNSSINAFLVQDEFADVI